MGCIPLSSTASAGGAAKGAARAPIARASENAAVAEQIRECMARERVTVREAIRRLGIAKERGKHIVRTYKIVSDPEVRERVLRESGERNGQRLNAARQAAAAELDGRILALYADRTRKEIARILGIKESRVKSALDRAAGYRKTKKQKAARAAAPISREQRLQAARAKRVSDAAALREAVAAGRTVKGAALHLGMRLTRAWELAVEFSIRADREALRIERRNSGQKGYAATASKPRKAAPLRERNPNLSAAQQAQVDSMKRRTWHIAESRMRDLPPVTDDEADALVRQWLARNRPTVCSPAASPETPLNAGARFK